MDLVLSGMNGGEKAEQISETPKKCPGCGSGLCYSLFHLLLDLSTWTLPGASPSGVPAARWQSQVWAGVSVCLVTQLPLLRSCCDPVSPALSQPGSLFFLTGSSTLEVITPWTTSLFLPALPGLRWPEEPPPPSPERAGYPTSSGGAGSGSCFLREILSLLQPLVLGQEAWERPGLQPLPALDLTATLSLYYQVAALCFVLVLGSLMPCLPEFSSGSQTVKEDPMATDGVYTASQSECPEPGCPSPAPTSGQKPGTGRSQVLGWHHLILTDGKWGLKRVMICSTLVVESGLQGRPLIPSLSRSG